MIVFVSYIVLTLSFFNLARMAFFLIASDIFDIKRNLYSKNSDSLISSAKKYSYRPLISVLVPAHNEEMVLRRTLENIASSTYGNIEVIVINDSSTDKTQSIAKAFQRKYRSRFKKIRVLRVSVRGKAPALNAGLVHARGSLFMCLDADSVLQSDAIERAVGYFLNDKHLVCLSSNVKILPGKGVLNIIQRIEYLMGYQMKKAEPLAGIQYIVGGVGSTYRTRVIRKIGGYDTDTLTEDIDLSMKILYRFKGKKHISYSPDVISYTESVQDLKGLLKQRFRWKYGRYQAFLKYRSLFFSRDNSYSRPLSWVYLPWALFSEFLNLLEPLVIGFMVYLIVSYGNPAIIAATVLVFFFYTYMNISGATTGYTLSERVKLTSLIPVAYIAIYILTFVEYVATIRGFLSFRKIHREHKYGTGGAAWKHVARRGDAVLVK